MNTLNGNFIERSIPNIKNATLNLLIGDQVATMNLADFQTAIFSSYSSSKGLKMKDGLPLSSTLNTVVDSNETITESPLQLSTEAVGLSRTVNLAAGATNPRLFNEVYTINNSGVQTGTLTGLFLNATETALNGITHNLMDLQVGGVSRLKLTNAGAITVSSTINSAGNITSGDSVLMANTGQLGWGVRSIITCSSDGNLTLKNSSGTSFSLLQLGGTTSSFPSIKRNGAAIDFRLADDSAYCNVSLRTVQCFGDVLSTGTGIFGSLVVSASAILQADSTTKGFLMPRMTTAQINAIAAPANGLQVYNTTISHTCCYQSGAWVKFNHSPM
jgi:hypothetical protein